MHERVNLFFCGRPNVQQVQILYIETFVVKVSKNLLLRLNAGDVDPTQASDWLRRTTRSVNTL